MSDITVFPDRIAAIEEKYQLPIGEVVADRGYGSGESLEFLQNKKIKTNIPIWSSNSGSNLMKEIANGFRIVGDAEKVHCPEGHEMRVSTRDTGTRRTIYTLTRATCMACPRAQSCLSAHEFKERAKRFAVPDWYKIFLLTLEK